MRPNRSGSPALRARTSWLGQQSPLYGPGCFHVGTLALVLDPQGLGQKRTLKNEAANAVCGLGEYTKAQSRRSRHTDHRSWALPLPPQCKQGVSAWFNPRPLWLQGGLDHPPVENTG